jgi:hypothetical protein
LARFRTACARGIGRAGAGAAARPHGLRGARPPPAAAAGRVWLPQGPVLPAVSASPLRVVLDACVLYPTVMREVLLGCAARGLFVPLWSPRLLEEWARAAARLGPEGEAVAADRGRRGGAGVPRRVRPHPPGRRGPPLAPRPERRARPGRRRGGAAPTRSSP